MNRHPDVTRLSSETLVTGRVFGVVRERIALPSGLEQDLLLVDHPGAVCVAPITDEGRLVLVRQYRHAAGAWLVELPAGRLEEGEEPLAAARRELEEETGYIATDWKQVTRFFAAPGFCSEVLTLFVARGLEKVPGGGLEADPDEEIELVERTLDEVLHGGEVEDAKTLLAAALLRLEGRDAS